MLHIVYVIKFFTKIKKKDKEKQQLTKVGFCPLVTVVVKLEENENYGKDWRSYSVLIIPGKVSACHL